MEGSWQLFSPSVKQSACTRSRQTAAWHKYRVHLFLSLVVLGRLRRRLTSIARAICYSLARRVLPRSAEFPLKWMCSVSRRVDFSLQFQLHRLPRASGLMRTSSLSVGMTESYSLRIREVIQSLCSRSQRTAHSRWFQDLHLPMLDFPFSLQASV